jgi:hypothetical protein
MFEVFHSCLDSRLFSSQLRAAFRAICRDKGIPIDQSLESLVPKGIKKEAMVSLEKLIMAMSGPRSSTKNLSRRSIGFAPTLLCCIFSHERCLLVFRIFELFKYEDMMAQLKKLAKAEADAEQDHEVPRFLIL